MSNPFRHPHRPAACGGLAALALSAALASEAAIAADAASWGAARETVVRLLPRRRRRPDARRRQRSRLRLDRQNPRIQRRQDRAVPDGPASEDAGHAAVAPGSQGPRRLYREPGGIARSPSSRNFDHRRRRQGNGRRLKPNFSKPNQIRPSRTKIMGLDCLGFLRPIPGFSMGYEQSKSKKLPRCILVAPATGLEACMLARAPLAEGFGSAHSQAGAELRVHPRIQPFQCSAATFPAFPFATRVLTARSRQRTFQFRASSRSSRTLIRLPVDPGPKLGLPRRTKTVLCRAARIDQNEA